MSGNECSQILLSIILAYYGSRGHRPRWIAVGMLCMAVSMVILASPHFIYGSGEEAEDLVKQNLDRSTRNKPRKLKY